MSAWLAYKPAETEPDATLNCQQIWPPASQAGRFAFASPTDIQAFGPEEFVALVHPDVVKGRRRGKVTFAVLNEDGWNQRKAAGDEAFHIAKELVAGSRDAAVYVSMNAFYGGRRIENLAGIGCCFSDVDYRNVESLKDADPRVVLTMLLAALDSDRIPPPSFAMDSGRGLYLIWLHDRLPAVALKRWNHVQARIRQCLEPFGADAAAKDAARVLRLPGSVNMLASLDRRRVGLLWSQGSPVAPHRYGFDEFADEILPYTRFEIRSIRAERAKRQAVAKTKPVRQARRRDGGSYGEVVLSDLERLRMFRNSNGLLAAGERDKWLFIAAMALTWMCPPEAVEAEIVELARRVAGWTPSEVQNRMTSVLARARDAQAGRTITFNGQKIDARYFMKASTMITWLGISIEEQQAAGLRLLVNDDVRKKRKVVEQRQRRRQKGAKCRIEAQTSRLALGRRAIWMNKREGLSFNEIAVELGVSKGLVMKAVGEARKTA